jgi:hypothetical protein
MKVNWKYTNETPVINSPVWIYTRNTFVFDLGFWDGRRWASWLYFGRPNPPDPGVVAWSNIDWSEVHYSLPEEMRINDNS